MLFSLAVSEVDHKRLDLFCFPIQAKRPVQQTQCVAPLTRGDMEEQGLVQDRLRQELRSGRVQDLENLSEGRVPGRCKGGSEWWVRGISHQLRGFSCSNEDSQTHHAISRHTCSQTTSNKSTHSGAKTVKGPGPERVSARSRATTAATRVERLASPCVPRVRIEAHMAVTSTRPQLQPVRGSLCQPVPNRHRT